MDKEELEIIKAAAEGTASGTVGRLLAPLLIPLSEGGEYLADVIRGRRALRQVKVLTRMYEMLDQAGLAAHVVPDKTLTPLLSYASLEDDDEMQERWAALLANAAAGDDGSTVQPGFAEILHQLAPVQARMLDALAASELGQMSLHRLADVGAWDLNDREAGPEVGVNFDNLARLGLMTVLRPDAHVVELVQNINQRDQAEARRGPRPSGGYSVPRAFSLSGNSAAISDLGRAFVAACAAPVPDDSE